MQASEFVATASAAYPLHPVTLIAFPFVFRRFAQNERSLFSYLSSLEPYGFQEYIKTHALTGNKPPWIRLGDLFDYFTRSMGAGFYRHPHALRWMEAADILERKDSLSPLQRDVVKTVGILNALGEFCHLKATKDVVSLAVSDTLKPNAELHAALTSHINASIITFRKFNKTYRIWEGRDVDIEERIAAINAFLKTVCEEREDHYPPYAMSVTVFTESSDECSVARWITQGKECWEAAEAQESLACYRRA